MNVFHQGPQLMSFCPIPHCLLSTLAHTPVSSRREVIILRGLRVALEVGLASSNSGSGSRPYPSWDLGKFLDLGQFLILICQVKVIL